MDPLPRARAVLSLRRVEVLDAHRAFASARRARERAMGGLAAAARVREAAALALEDARGRGASLRERPSMAGAHVRHEGIRHGLAERLEIARRREAAEQAVVDGARAAEEQERARLERALRARESAERAVARAERARPRARERREAWLVEDRVAGRARTPR